MENEKFQNEQRLLHYQEGEFGNVCILAGELQRKALR